MTVQRHIVKSCCGSRSFIFEVDKPIRKFQLSVFTDAGYAAPPSFKSAGIFYVRGFGIVATSSFGARKISVKCSGGQCSSQLDKFSALLDQAVNVTG